jgi:hypothetical protein
MKKRLLLMLVLALLLALGICSAAWAATVDSGECGDNLTWTLDSDGTLTISGNGAMWEESQYSYPWSMYGDSISHPPVGVKFEPINKIIINNGVTSIGAGAFERFEKLTEVRIPNTVYSIGNDAFSRCTELESITIPGSVEIIRNGVFENCASLSEVNIENGVKYIESWAFNGSFNAFSGCYNLTEIYIPSSIIRIENNAFAGCSNLMNIIVDNNNVQYSSYDGALYNKEGSTLIICPPGKQNIELNSHTTKIDANAFDNYSDGTKLEIIEFPPDIEYLPFHIFSNCSKLKEVKLPDKITYLNATFYNCSNLETVYIPISVKRIESDTFYRCYNLKEIIYAGTQEQWDSIRIDDGNAELSNVKITYLGNGSTTDPDEPNKPTDPEQPDKPTDPDKPTTPEKPDTLPITSRPGGLGSRLTVRVEGGHWLTVQVRRAGTIALSSIQAPGTGMMTLTFSAAAGSVVQVWETENEMTFTNSVPNNKILATNVKNV